MNLNLAVSLCIAIAVIPGTFGQALAGVVPVTIWSESRFPPGAESVPIADDSEASRRAAITRLRAAPSLEVCRDKAVAVRTYGTACSSREFVAPPLLTKPKIQWMNNRGWWGAWSPFLIGNLMLTGSCNNEDNKGLSALDMRSGKTLWRIPKICEEGNRGGSMGEAAFFELSADSVLLRLNRNDGAPTDLYVINIKEGKILRTLKPVKRGGLFQYDGGFMVVTYSIKEQTTYLNALNQDMSETRWRLDQFRAPCEDKLLGCPPVFSAGAFNDGIQYFTVNAKAQQDPPTRQLHAFDVQTGKVLWKHVDQQVYRAQFRSDDGSPMVANGKVLIRADGLNGPTSLAGGYSSYALRALDARSGKILWTTESIPADFKQKWPADAKGVKSQILGNYIVSGSMLIAEVHGGVAFKEFWGYRLSDGRLMWRRTMPPNMILTASAGGMFYATQFGTANVERVPLQGLDAQTGTLIWTTTLPAHNLDLYGGWGIRDNPRGGLQGPDWRIGRDGAIYGVTLKGTFKIQ